MEAVPSARYISVYVGASVHWYTVAQKSVPMFVAFHVIASLGVRVWESD